MESSVNGTSNLNGTEGSIKICDLENILRESQNDSHLQVIDLAASSLVPTGENYSSIMVKIEAKIRRGSGEQEEVLHLVAKTMKHMEKSFVIWTDVLRKEIFLYAKLIPMYRELEIDAGVAEKDLIDCVPKYMGHRYTMKSDSNEVDDHSLLLMENMKVQGYYMGDRKKGLDFQHAVIALTNLARYHALGVVLRQKRSHDFEKAKQEAATLGLVIDEFEVGYDILLQTFEEESCFAQNISEIKASFARYKKNKDLPEATEPWVTIIHGDFWTNNLLFHQDDNGKVDSVKFVDFQMYLYASPCRDLTYFICCSLDQDLYDRVDELLELYFRKFIDTLRCMRCDSAPFTRKSFDEELKKELVYGFPIFALCHKYFSYEVSEEEKTDREIAKSVMHSKCSKLCKEKLIRLVRIYDERRWFQ